MSRYVLDNTVAMAWCFTEEATEFARTLLSRLSNLTDSASEKAAAFLESLADLPIEVENPSRIQVFVAVLALAAQHQLCGPFRSSYGRRSPARSFLSIGLDEGIICYNNGLLYPVEVGLG